MIGVEQRMEIRGLAKHGKGVREIARDVGVPRNTVRRYLRDTTTVRYKARPERPAKLDLYRSYIEPRWRRCMIHFYRNVFSHVPSSKVREVSHRLKAIHAQESRTAAQEKAETVTFPAVVFEPCSLGLMQPS